MHRELPTIFQTTCLNVYTLNSKGIRIYTWIFVGASVIAGNYL